MRTPALLALAAAALLARTAAAAPAAVTDPKKIASAANHDAHPLEIEKLFMARQLGGADVAPDGKTIVFVGNLSGRRNLWLVPSDGGWPTQLTVSDQRQIDPKWSPDGKWISFESDHDGDEQWDLSIVSPITGHVINLTNTPDVAEEDAAWSPDSKVLVYAIKPRASSTYELDMVSLDHGARLHLTSGTDKAWSNGGPRWSPDGKSLAFTRYRADEKDANVFVVRLAGGEDPVNLTPHEGEKTHWLNAWSPDGRELLITSNADNGYQNVATLHVDTKKLEWLTHDQWETNAGAFSPDGKTILWSANVDGNSDVYQYSRAQKKARALGLPEGVNSLGRGDAIFTKDGKRFLFFHDGPDSPRDVFVQTLGGKARRVTQSLVAGLRPSDMVAPFLVHYPSHDKKWTISAFVYVPFNLERNGRHPGIVLVHGGPEAQAENSFSPLIQSLVSEGYVIIEPNYRGSTGYGKAYQDANRFDMGGGDLDDVLASAEFLVDTGFVDAKKLVISGRSYGGYMTMMGVTKAPERWAAGVSIVPFVNWFTEVKNEDPLLQQYDLATMGDPDKNKQLWHDRSPLFYVDQIAAPIMLLAGGHDPRCPKSEAQQVYDAVKKRGGIIEMKIYDNEGHHFDRVENQIDANHRVIDFLKKHVPPTK
jgi:dipeptidyl aminopeptidase/acylaminoacyl peptidase